MPYPDGYRGWTHVKSMIIEEGHPLHDSFGGIHHVYANERALTGLKQPAGQYADGAVFAFDLLVADRAGGAISEGSRKVLGVMHHDAEAFSATGGWGFAGFAGDTRNDVVVDAAASCFNCHEHRADRGYVFSEWRN